MDPALTARGGFSETVGAGSQTSMKSATSAIICYKISQRLLQKPTPIAPLYNQTHLYERTQSDIFLELQENLVFLTNTILSQYVPEL